MVSVRVTVGVGVTNRGEVSISDKVRVRVGLIGSVRARFRVKVRFSTRVWFRVS